MRPQERRAWFGPIGWVSGTEWKNGDRPALLRPHQARAVASALAAMEGRGPRLMKRRRGIMLADDVGMGKTREAIAAVALYMSRHRIRQPLFVVPPSLVDKWREEIRDFCAEGRQLARTKRVQRAVDRLSRHRVTWVMSTSQFRSKRHIGRIDILVVDEAHKLKNRHSKLSQAAVRFVRRHNPRVLLLTATPFQCEHQRELLHLLSFLDENAQQDSSEVMYTAGRGFHSIVGGLAAGLRRLDSHLRTLRTTRDENLKTFQELREELDRNLDLVDDPHRRTFGVAHGKSHDGFDEFLRALIVRNVKPRALVRESNVEMSESDTAAYLFGRSYYLERRLKSAVDGGSFAADPPPGSGFLPNAYSRLCSTYAAQRPRSRSLTGRAHPQAALLESLTSREALRPLLSGHPKVRALARSIKGLARHEKVVVFANHLATVHQLRVIARSLAGNRTARKRPLTRDLAAAARFLKHDSWKGALDALGSGPLSTEEQAELTLALGRHLAGTPRKAWKELLRYYVDVTTAAAREPTPRRVRRYLRERMEGREHRTGRALTTGLRLRDLSVVEALDGSVPQPRRLRLLQAFNHQGVPPFILIVSQAGSEGQDMHHACSRVIHHDLHWNPTVLHQRTGRVYRDKVDVSILNVEELVLLEGYDSTIREYARKRDAYRDFLLGERALGDFLKDLAGTKFDQPWRMDLTPELLSFEARRSGSSAVRPPSGHP